MRDPLADRSRLAAIAATNLLDQPALQSLDELTQIARRMLRTPAALITIVTEDRQFLASAHGVVDPWRRHREMPLSYSFCQHTVRTGRPLVVRDAREDSALRGNRAIEELGVIAYAGVPLITEEGHTLGALCVTDTRPREWSRDEIDVLLLLRSAVVSQIRFNEQLRQASVHAAELESAMGQLAHRKRFYRALTENAFDLVTVLAADGTIAYESPSVRTVLGYAPEDLVGRNAFEFVHADDRVQVEEQFRDVLADSEAPRSLEFRFRHADGSFRILNGKGVNRISDPAIAGIVFNASDVTQTRRAEERLRLVQKNETIAQLAAGLVHDLNNALTVIIANADLIAMSESLDSPTREGVGDIREAASGAAELTRRLLAAGRHAPIEPRALELAPVLERVIRLAARALPRSITVDTAIDPATRVWGDPGALEQVVLNLIGNSRDAMPDGGALTLRAGIEPTTAEFRAKHGWAIRDEYVVIAVRDTGTGMDENTLDRIFDPFFTTKAEGHGTGLGIPMVAGIAAQLGGGIAITSAPGKGTVVAIYLPVATKEGKSG